MGTHGYFRPMVFIVKPLSNYAKPGTPFIRLFWLSFTKITAFHEQLCEHCTEMILIMVKSHLLHF